MWCAQAVPCGGNSPCYWLKVGNLSSYTYCAADEDRFYWEESNVFMPYDKVNWRTSLGEAKGFAKQIYVYSYPQRVYVNYDGMGADGLCASWSESSSNVNTYNANKKINYSNGNPVCNSKVQGSMPQNFINYYQGDTNDANRNYTISKNQYMKTGYDFQGWVLDKNCLNADGTIKNTACKIYADQQVITNTPGAAPTGLGANAGDTVTLYAV